MQSEGFRVQALRFVDVLPALDDDRELTEHLHEYFGHGDFPLTGLLRFGVHHVRGDFANAIIGGSRFTARRSRRRPFGARSCTPRAVPWGVLGRERYLQTLDRAFNPRGVSTKPRQRLMEYGAVLGDPSRADCMWNFKHDR